MRRYSDGYLVVYFEETDSTVRPVAIDATPDCRCCVVLVDFGMATEDGHAYLDPEDWKESDWQWLQLSEGCGKDSNGISITTGT
ncbi:MAG TPA: hypothetical protein ENH62_16300 [Marinobacter sp.]|nr:hypothetical protein [Marinobacter sp.]